MVLVEDMVSRRHAAIRVNGDSLEVEDLGSTNGTFVNGERVQKASLSEGDRLLIGTSIIRIVRGAGAASMVPLAVEDDAGQPTEYRTGKGKAMSGSVSEVPVPDLLQLFSAAKKTGTLTVRNEVDTGKLHIVDGRIAFATLNGNDDIEPAKSAFRIIAWRDGSFEMGPLEEESFAKPLNISTEALLMEAMHQADELARLGPDMPPLTAHISLAVPLIPQLSQLDEESLDVVQLAHNYGHVETILNRSGKSDLATATAIVNLLRQNYFRLD